MNPPVDPAPKTPALDALTAAALVVALVLTAAVYARLPDSMPTHYDLSGKPNGWMPRALGAWVLPISGVFVVLVVRFAGGRLPPGARERLAASPVKLVSLCVAVSQTALQIILLRASLSATPRLGGELWVVLGATFIVLGLALPRVRRNPFFGVRTSFALASDETWARMQRVGGYSMTIGGLVALVAGLLGAHAAAISALLISAVVPLVWPWVSNGRAKDDAAR
jgi:uncharacterized membrane protein